MTQIAVERGHAAVMFKQQIGAIEMTRYQNDPRWIKARFSSECPMCHGMIKKGAQIFYYPRTKTALCADDKCGGAASRQFAAEAADEDFMNGVW